MAKRRNYNNQHPDHFAVGEKLARASLKPASSPEEATWHQALTAFDNRNFDLGLQLIRGLLAAQPNTPHYLCTFGRALSDTGKHAEAIEALKKAVELAPNVHGYRLELGLAMMKCNDFAAAEPLLSQVLEQITSGVDGKDDAQAAAYVMAELPNADLASYALVNLATCRLMVGKFSSAEELLNLAVRHMPNNSSCWVMLGQVKEQLAKTAEAKKAYARVLQLGTDPQTTAFARGQLATLG